MSRTRAAIVRAASSDSKTSIDSPLLPSSERVVALRKAEETFGNRDPAPITVDEVAAWVAAIARTHKPGAVQLYWLTFRLWRLLFVTIEQGARRLGEAVSLRWADVDAANLRLRLPRSATKRDRARWVYLPAWLVETIEATCPLKDRVPERKVFPGIPERPRTRRCRVPAATQRCRTTTRTT